jgi:deoxyribodipyrimidine photolyase-related protein
MQTGKIERLVVVLGDQLNHDSAALKRINRQADVVWMAEASEESTHVWSHKSRITIFLSAMRHFRDELIRKKVKVTYHELRDADAASLSDILLNDLQQLKPSRVVMVRAGDYRTQASIALAVKKAGLDFEVLEDQHFLCGLEAFNAWADGRKQLRLENFYRFMRKNSGVLMQDGGPAGGQWNYDDDNRKTFGRKGPGMLSVPKEFKPDKTTASVIKITHSRFADHPGSTDEFSWPVTRRQAL